MASRSGRVAPLTCLHSIHSTVSSKSEEKASCQSESRCGRRSILTTPAHPTERKSAGHLFNDENRVLRQQIDKRILLTEHERRTLAEKAIALGKLMAGTVT